MGKSEGQPCKAAPYDYRRSTAESIPDWRLVRVAVSFGDKGLELKTPIKVQIYQLVYIWTRNTTPLRECGPKERHGTWPVTGAAAGTI
jgi:hypothetical protein